MTAENTISRKDRRKRCRACWNETHRNNLQRQRRDYASAADLSKMSLTQLRAEIEKLQSDVDYEAKSVEKFTRIAETQRLKNEIRIRNASARFATAQIRLVKAREVYTKKADAEGSF
jgi:hypothetical protein